MGQGSPPLPFLSSSQESSLEFNPRATPVQEREGSVAPGPERRAEKTESSGKLDQSVEREKQRRAENTALGGKTQP